MLHVVGDAKEIFAVTGIVSVEMEGLGLAVVVHGVINQRETTSRILTRLLLWILAWSWVASPIRCAG
jgi:hypothetical protein